MDERREKLLLDAQAAAEAIAVFTTGADGARFHADALLRSAVERQFEILGEALNRLRRADPDWIVGVSEVEKIIGFRNVLAHGYDVIDDGITWDIVVNKLPRLQAEIRAMLA